jgi:hypothetical protein
MVMKKGVVLTDKVLSLILAGVFVIIQIALVFAYFRVPLPSQIFWMLSDFTLILICGLIFYNVARGNEPELNIAQLGARIGGGAAIGVAVVFCIQFFLLPLQFKNDTKVVDVSRLPTTVALLNASPNISYLPIHNGKELMVYFEDRFDGEIAAVDLSTHRNGTLRLFRDGSSQYVTKGD